MSISHENDRLRQQVTHLRQKIQSFQDQMTDSHSSNIGSNAAFNLNPQDSEALFRAYVETANDMVYTVDLEGRLTFINAYGQRLLHCCNNEWLHRPYLDFVAPESRQQTAYAFANLLETGELKDYEFMIQPLAGAPVCMEVNGRLLYRQGELIGGLGIARDITERKRFEQQLQMFLRAIESAYDSSVIVNLDGQIVYANPATERVFGYDVTEVYGQNAAIFYPQDSQAPLTWLIDQAIRPRSEMITTSSSTPAIFTAVSTDRLTNRQPTPGWSGEIICRRQTGEHFPAIISVSPILHENGEAMMVSITCRDITNQKAIQAELAAKNIELERASRHKSAFLANMSHELRTPLTAILGFASLLLQEIFGSLSDKQKFYVRSIEDSGAHLLRLIKDILDLSKIEAGKLKLNLNKVRVETVCQEVLMLIKEQAKQRHIQLECQLQPDLKPIEVDELRVRQMLLNLLSNALKFSDPGGSIGLEAEARSGGLYLTVWDEGVGISPEEQVLLFQPFQQLDSSLSREHDGTGLGLALTQKLAILHGGQVICQSTLGKGSRFTIVLPYERSINQEALGLDFIPFDLTSNTAPQPNPQNANYHLMLVEDRESNALLICDILHYWGYQVHHVWSGREALMWLNDHQPDLILMDINLPEINGLEVTQRIKQNPQWSHIPVVAMTALAMVGDRERCLAAGVQDYVSKPINYEHLARVIDQHLAKK